MKNESIPVFDFILFLLSFFIARQILKDLNQPRVFLLVELLLNWRRNEL